MCGSLNKLLISYQIASAFFLVLTWEMLQRRYLISNVSAGKVTLSRATGLSGPGIDTVVHNRHKPQQCRKALQVAVLRRTQDDPLPDLFHEDALPVL